MPDEKLNADSAIENFFNRPPDIKSTPSKEYTDDKGEKIVISDVELSRESLQSMSPKRMELIFQIHEKENTPICKNCRFWNPTEIRQNKDGNPFPINGECRVNAPTNTLVYEVDAGRIGYSNSFPLIGPFQWCGKHEKIA